MKKRMPFFLAGMTAAAVAAAASGDVLYKCTDKASQAVLFTNQKVKGKTCVVISRSPPRSVSVRQSGSAQRSTVARATPSPADFPRVSAATQQRRDDQRRTILEQELDNERSNLETARDKQIPNKIKLHERNIEALNKELARLR